MSRELSNWSESQKRSRKWTQRNRSHELNQILDQADIGRAIGLIKRGKIGKYSPTHDDIIAKLTFSFWVNLIKDQEKPADMFRRRLWEENLNQAFPYAQNNDEKGFLDLEKTRILTVRQLSSILDLRNRIAHHDNLLSIQYEKRVHRIYAILGRIGGTDLTESVDPAPLRAHIAMDPRKSWGRRGQDLEGN